MVLFYCVFLSPASLTHPIKEEFSTVLKPYGGFLSGKFEPNSVRNLLSVEY